MEPLMSLYTKAHGERVVTNCSVCAQMLDSFVGAFLVRVNGCRYCPDCCTSVMDQLGHDKICIPDVTKEAAKATEMSAKMVGFAFESTDPYGERLFDDCTLCLQKMDSHSMSFVQCSDGHNFCERCYQYLMMQIALKRIQPEKTTENEQKGESRTEANGEQPKTTEKSIPEDIISVTNVHIKRLVTSCFSCTREIDSFFVDVFSCDTKHISFCAKCFEKCKVSRKDVPSVKAPQKEEEQKTTATAPSNTERVNEDIVREQESSPPPLINPSPPDSKVVEEVHVRKEESPPDMPVAPSHFCATCKEQSSFEDLRVCVTCATSMDDHQNTGKTPETDPLQLKEWHFCSNCILDFHVNKGHHQEKLKDSAMLHQRLDSVQDSSRNIQSVLQSLEGSMREREQNYKTVSMICELVNKEANHLSARDLSEIYHIFSEILPLSVKDKDVQQRMTMNRKVMMTRIPFAIAERIQREQKNFSTSGTENVVSEDKTQKHEEKCKQQEDRTSRKTRRNGGGESTKAERVFVEQIAKLDTQKTELEEKISSIQETLRIVEAKEAKGRETIKTLKEKVASLETEDKNRLRVWTAENIEVLVEAIRKQDERGEEEAIPNLKFKTGCVKKFQVCIPSEAYWQRDGVIVSLKETLCLTHIGLYKQSRDVGALKVRVRVSCDTVVFSDFMVQLPYTEKVNDNVHLVELPRKILMLNTVRYYFELTFDRPARLWWGFGGAGKMDIPGFPGNKITFSLQDTAFEGQIPEFHFTDQLITKPKKNRIIPRRKQ